MKKMANKQGQAERWSRSSSLTTQAKEYKWKEEPLFIRSTWGLRSVYINGSDHKTFQVPRIKTATPTKSLVHSCQDVLKCHFAFNAFYHVSADKSTPWLFAHVIVRQFLLVLLIDPKVSLLGISSGGLLIREKYSSVDILRQASRQKITSP